MIGKYTVTVGITDYLKDGKRHRIAEQDAILVSSVSDLDLLGDVKIGSIAYTAGFAKMWQKDIDGEWVSIV